MQYKKKYINDKILEAGREEYLEKGFRAGNISTIANNAGVPVGNLYRYFDGKSGLLDAIVKPAYIEIPKIITKLAVVPEGMDVSLEDFMSKLSEELLYVFDDYGKDIIILVDKCATTRYEDFAEKLITQISGVVVTMLFPVNPTETDKEFSLMLSKAFMNCLFDIFRNERPRTEMQEFLLRILKFFFYETERRTKI